MLLYSLVDWCVINQQIMHEIGIFDGKLVFRSTQRESYEGSAILWWKQDSQRKWKFIQIFFKSEVQRSDLVLPFNEFCLESDKIWSFRICEMSVFHTRLAFPVRGIHALCLHLFAVLAFSGH